MWFLYGIVLHMYDPHAARRDKGINSDLEHFVWLGMEAGMLCNRFVTDIGSIGHRQRVQIMPDISGMR